MPARNDITGDSIVTRNTGDSFRDGWDRIFGKKEKTIEVEETKDEEVRDSEQSDG